MKTLKDLYIKYMTLLMSDIKSNKFKESKWCKGSELDAEFAFATDEEKEDIMQRWQIKMKEFKEKGHKNVDQFIL